MMPSKTNAAKGGHLMSIIGWIVLGIIIGFVASRVAHKKGRGIIPDIILGIAGSIVGGDHHGGPNECVDRSALRISKPLRRADG
jgi:hypothetical protein